MAIFFLDPTRPKDYTVTGHTKAYTIVKRVGDRHGRMQVPSVEWRKFLSCAESLTGLLPSNGELDEATDLPLVPEPPVVPVGDEAVEPDVPGTDEPGVPEGDAEPPVTQPDSPAEAEKQPEQPATETKAQRRARERAEAEAAAKANAEAEAAVKANAEDEAQPKE